MQINKHKRRRYTKISRLLLPWAIRIAGILISMSTAWKLVSEWIGSQSAVEDAAVKKKQRQSVDYKLLKFFFFFSGSTLFTSALIIHHVCSVYIERNVVQFSPLSNNLLYLLTHNNSFGNSLKKVWKYKTDLFEVSFLYADSTRNFTLLQLLITLMKSKQFVNSKMESELRTWVSRKVKTPKRTKERGISSGQVPALPR